MTREITFTEQRVEQWCERSGNHNPVHLDEEAAADGTFGRRVVPNMMLMDHIPGMLTDLADDDETLVVSGITAARFRDPVLLGERVTMTTEIIEEDRRYTMVDFECRVEERGSLVANGSLTILID